MSTNHKIDIYSPRFVGQRFDDHTLPLELMEDISALEDVTIELAKWIYLKDNPNRQRIPRGFTNGMEIKLEAIEPGSTILKIALFVVSANLFPPENSKYFEKASEKLINAIQAAENNEDATEYVPESFLTYFNRIGKKLQKDESIEFTPLKLNKARLTKESRKRLILASSKNKEYTDEIEIRGFISEMDKSKKTFQIQLLNGQKITGNFNSQNTDSLQEAFNDYENKRIIKIEGIAKFNNSEIIEFIEHIDNLEILDDLDIPSRIEIISLLKDGWLNGEGKAPITDHLNWFSKSFETNYSPELPLPYLYPTPEGNIQAEWSINNFDVSLIIELESKKSILNLLSLTSEEEKEIEIYLEEEIGWTNLNSEIKTLIAG